MPDPTPTPPAPADADLRATDETFAIMDYFTETESELAKLRDRLAAAEARTEEAENQVGVLSEWGKIGYDALTRIAEAAGELFATPPKLAEVVECKLTVLRSAERALAAAEAHGRKWKKEAEGRLEAALAAEARADGAERELLALCGAIIMHDRPGRHAVPLTPQTVQDAFAVVCSLRFDKTKAEREAADLRLRVAELEARLADTYRAAT